MAGVVFYINYDGSGCSVYESQIYTYCNALGKNNLKVVLINCETNIKPAEDSENEIFQILYLEKGRFDFLISRKLVNEIAGIIGETMNQKVVIHCRGVFGSCIGLMVKKKLKMPDIKVISDIRGAAAEEYITRYKHNNILYKLMIRLAVRRINYIQGYVCRNSDYIFCVSKKLEGYLRERHPVNCSFFIMPTCVSAEKNGFNPAERIIKRNELKLQDKFVIVYSGGGQEYQNPQGLTEAFKNISTSMTNTFFLILTRDTEVFQAAFKNSNLLYSSYLIMSVTNKELNNYLSAGDCSIMLREENQVNKVASPTKFAEYVNCHLPVFISRGIGDIDEISIRYPVCIYEEEIENFQSRFVEIKKNEENFRLLIEQYYSLENRIKEAISIYGMNR